MNAHSEAGGPDAGSVPNDFDGMQEQLPPKELTGQAVADFADSLPELPSMAGQAIVRS